MAGFRNGKRAKWYVEECYDVWHWYTRNCSSLDQRLTLGLCFLQVTVIVACTFAVGILTGTRSTFPAWTAFPVLALYPLAIAGVAFLDTALGWHWPIGPFHFNSRLFFVLCNSRWILWSSNEAPNLSGQIAPQHFWNEASRNLEHRSLTKASIAVECCRAAAASNI